MCNYKALLTLLATCAATVMVQGDDLPWKFDDSARTPDVKALAAPAANGESWSLQPGRSASSSSIPLFNSCWIYDVESGGWSYAFEYGFYLLFR